MLSQAEIDRYREDGFVVPDHRLSAELIGDIRAAHARLVARHPEFSDYCPALLAFDTWFLNVARDPGILALVEQLIGPDIALWNSSFFAKPARVGTRTPWHQDGEYWPIRPLATCSVWIAVDDATTENGCLRFIPGSHRSGTLSAHEYNDAAGLSLPLEMKADTYDARQAVDVELEAGQISLHDVFLAHASEANTSDKPRRGMTLRYMPTTSVYRRDLAGSRPGRSGPLDMAERTLYLMRGQDASGANDFRIRF